MSSSKISRPMIACWLNLIKFSSGMKRIEQVTIATTNELGWRTDETEMKSNIWVKFIYRLFVHFVLEFGLKYIHWEPSIRLTESVNACRLQHWHAFYLFGIYHTSLCLCTVDDNAAHNSICISSKWIFWELLFMQIIRCISIHWTHCEWYFNRTLNLYSMNLVMKLRLSALGS